MPAVNIGDVKLYYEDYGQGQPLILVLGLGQDVATWGYQMAEELSSEMADAKLIIFEQGGHGLYWEVPELFNEAVIDFIKRPKDEHRTSMFNILNAQRSSF